MSENFRFSPGLVLIAGFGVLYARKTLKAIEGQLTEIKSAGQQTDLLIRHAGDQSETARQSLLITQRAFFTHVRYQLTTMFSEPNNQGSLLFFRFVVEYENVGKTPAIEAEMTLGFWKIKKGDSDDFLLPPWEEREGPRIGSRVAPGIKVVGTLDLDREDAEKIATEELSIFLYTQAQYRDVFEGTPIHSSGTCVRLMKIADLRSSAPFQFKLHSARYNYGD